MGFTTQTFLFVFFPLCILLYSAVTALERCGKIGVFLCRLRLKDITAILLSLAFYAWACFDDVFWLIFYILIVYLAARIIEGARMQKSFLGLYRETETGDAVMHKRVYAAVFPFIISVAAVVLCLVIYKYTGFFLQVFTGSSDTKNPIAPLGLSFITFSAISYLADIYRGKASCGSLIDCALYLTFFPKVVSGPIVLWKNFQPQIKERRTSLEMISRGLDRIMIGFAKKVIIADTLGACLAEINIYAADRVTAAGTLLLYMMQIYYDFAGYSDIAIGLACLFGFKFDNNFDFPYRSQSISEFWRRWHISLGSWFREYIYFPLGGSRAGLKRTLFNLGVVFLLTGIWHGAGWNYILWGVINGIAVIVERLIQKKQFYIKTPDIVKWLCTMTVVICLWQLFRYENISDAAHVFSVIFGFEKAETVHFTWQYYFNARIILFVLAGVIGSTLLGSPRVKAIYDRVAETKAGFIIQEIVLLTLFALSILFMVNSTYSPFLYFRY